MKKYEILRKKYPRFIFESFNWKLKNKNLEIIFNFKICPEIKFKPTVTIEGVSEKEIKRVGKRVLDNLIFNLGLIEMISYWKCTASPEIEILAGNLNKEQIKWWKTLILKGMGQFFFENNINFKSPGFLKIKGFKDLKRDLAVGEFKLDEKKVLVPVGGGKDSIVTIEYLKRIKKRLILFCLNPKIHQRKIIKISKIKEVVFAKRKIDKKLLELNRQGFLNGHTPFTAYLSFLSVLIACLKDCKFIAFSNEKSANEGNLKYLGTVINHQYSKSEDFEKRFRDYSKKYLAKKIEYFSILRPYYELEIAKMFSQFPQYFNSFLSCNTAFQTLSGKKKPIKRWCGKCPKCLSVFIMLYPFLKEKTIQIFKKNLFEDKSLLSIMLQLIGKKDFKPLECVGTKKETFLALKMALEYFKRKNKKLPYLLKYFEKISLE